MVVVWLLNGCGDRAGSGGPTGPRLLDATPGSEVTAAAPDFQPLPGAKAYFGMLGRAAYRIEIPKRWNGELLLWAHAVRGFGPEVSVENPPPALRQRVVDQGYAWAASSFSENGYAPGIGVNDTLALKEYFAGRFGWPKRTYIAGNSMGGNIVTLSLENFPEEYDGGLAFCGAVSGVELIDYLLSWDLVAAFVAGVDLPLGQGEAKVTAAMQGRIVPVLGRPDSPTAAGQAFASVIRNLTGGPRPFFMEGYREQYATGFAFSAGDPDRTLPVIRASTNEGVDYRVDPGLGFDGELLNQGVRRIQPDPALRDVATHPDMAPTTGKIQDPLLTLHETGDLAVPISVERSYRQKAEAAGAGDLLVQRVIRASGHCKFSDTEVTQAWDDLVEWVAGKRKPPGDDVLGDLSDAGRTFTNPLRANDPGNR